MLRRLDEQGRPAEPVEQQVLARWSSWGSLPKVFDELAAEFGDARTELRELLDESEWAGAARTTLNAHYTDYDVASAMWRAMTTAGFEGGRLLEPGCGSGTFLATTPAGLDVEAVGVELDPITARIAKALHPQASIRVESFGVTRFPDGWFDATIGNVPFGDYKVFDPIYNSTGMSIHNHFIAKSLRLTRPGGYVMVLTSRFTLDAKTGAARGELAALGDLVGAVRLPEGAMRRVAGTGVAMDLLILRRREDGVAPAGQAWAETASVPTPDGPVRINEVFAAHPEWVLGTLRAEHGQYGQDDVEVRALPGPLAPLLDEALDDIIARAAASGLGYKSRPRIPAGVAANSDPVVYDAIRGRHHVEGSLLRTTSEGFAVIRDGITMAYSPPRPQAGELAMMIDLRDAYFELVDTQSTVASDDAWRPIRGRLNDLYDRYHRLYGPVNRFTLTRTGHYDKEDGTPIMARRLPPMGGFKDDPGMAVVRALENFDSETQTSTKAAIFERRVLAPRQVATSAESAQDALALCLDERGHVDVETIARLLSRGPAEAREALGTLVYDDPEGPRPLPAAQYLSGNVRQRLGAARAAAGTDARFEPNVAALEAVQPRDLEPGEIEAHLGAGWIAPADIEAFCTEVLDADVNVEYAPATGTWAVRLATGSSSTVTLRSEWGTERMPGIWLIEANANQRIVTVKDEGPDGKRVTNLAETLAAREKQEAITERFGAWVWEDERRAARLTTEYNARFNSVVLPTYDGSHLSLPGLAESFAPHPHQRDVVWRMLSEPTVLMAHAVGAGKTASMVIGGQELKRLGMVNKPAYVVPNHMLEQFSREYMQLYPAANILVATSDDLTEDKRKEFIARCAAEDWDAVIITHNSFKRIPVSVETQMGFLDARTAELRESITASRTEGNGITVKQLEKTLARLEERHQKLLAGPRDEGGVTWESTGIDYIICDESQAYKNLAISSHIQGVGSKPSQLAEDLAMKIDWLRAKHPSKVATFATATPISNSISEMYVTQRFLQPDTLAAAGVSHFDGWAANFGRTVVALELAPDASTYRMTTRFARFANVPDLLRMFRAVADVRTADQLNLALPELEGGKFETVVVDPADDLRAYVAELAERAKAIRNGQVDPDKDNMLMVTGDGRKAALDLRLVGLPADPAGGKVAAAADEIASIYLQTNERSYVGADNAPSARPGALQIVFCDLGTPHDDDRWTVYDQLRDELVARAVPAESIQFMHDAGDDRAKARLFAAARAGSVSVLVGSTQKMGVGTNVQARAVALHHLDCPWRPADLEQRDGRILRQGNQNPEVRIVRYVTEASFDVFSWQTVQRKASFIAQVMRGDITERSIEDVGDQALSYAEVKALATGNPLIMERAGVESELTKLVRLQASYRDEQASLARRVRSNEREAKDQGALADVYRDAASRALDTSGARFTMVVDRQRYAKRPEAAAALQAVTLREQRTVPIGKRETIPVAELAGFSVMATISHDSTETSSYFSLHGVPGFTPTLTRHELGTGAPLGTLTRLENLSEGLDRKAADAAARAAQAHQEATKAVVRIGRPFEHSGRITSLRERLAAIDAELAPVEDEAGETYEPDHPPPATNPPTSRAEFEPSRSVGGDPGPTSTPPPPAKAELASDPTRTWRGPFTYRFSTRPAQPNHCPPDWTAMRPKDPAGHFDHGEVDYAEPLERTVAEKWSLEPTGPEPPTLTWEGKEYKLLTLLGSLGDQVYQLRNREIGRSELEAAIKADVDAYEVEVEVVWPDRGPGELAPVEDEVDEIYEANKDLGEHNLAASAPPGGDRPPRAGSAWVERRAGPGSQHSGPSAADLARASEERVRHGRSVDTAAEAAGDPHDAGWEYEIHPQGDRRGP